MQQKGVLLSLSLLMLAQPVLAEFSANVTVASDYVWRGVTQTDNQAAVQGGLDYAHTSGVYVGAWASNVNYPKQVNVVDASGQPVTIGGQPLLTTEDDGGFEFDLFGGYAGSIGQFGYDLGLIYYGYSDQDDSNFVELSLGGGYQIDLSGAINSVTLSAAAYYTVDAQKGSSANDGDIYYSSSIGLGLPQGFGLALTAGFYSFDDSEETSEDRDYGHFQLDLSRDAGEYGALTLSFSKADEEAGNPNGDDAIFFVSWDKSF